MSTEKEYTFEDYLNCDLFDVHRWSDYPEVKAVRKQIMAELGFKESKKEVTHVTVVLLNLYRTYCLDPDMWVLYSRDRNDYNYGSRYNKLFLKYRNMIKTVDGLHKLGYIESAKGFNDRKTMKAFDARMKATVKLTDVIEKQHGVKYKMIGQWAPDELVVLRDANGEPVDYVETKDIKQMVSVLEGYNKLLSETYIDIHFTIDDIRDLIAERKKKKDNVTGLPKDYRLSINLSNKRVRRIFNRSTFNSGGRFYGGWWQNIPSELRRRIIIGSDYTIETDYSGLHIYLLYAFKGINFADYDKEPYIYPKDKDPNNYRRILKLLLLAAVNSSTEIECIRAVQFEINMNRSDYPKNIPDLKEAYAMFKEYHLDIVDLFCNKNGLQLQRFDSNIAHDIIRVMTDYNIPVLVVHDSFVCPKPEQDFLTKVMLKVYNLHAAKLGVTDAALTSFTTTPIAMKTDDVTTELPIEHKDEDILINHLCWLGEPQTRRFARYHLDDDPATNIVIKVFNNSITEVGFDIEEPNFEQCDWLMHEDCSEDE